MFLSIYIYVWQGGGSCRPVGVKHTEKHLRASMCLYLFLPGCTHSIPSVPIDGLSLIPNILILRHRIQWDRSVLSSLVGKGMVLPASRSALL